MIVFNIELFTVRLGEDGFNIKLLKINVHINLVKF